MPSPEARAPALESADVAIPREARPALDLRAVAGGSKGDGDCLSDPEVFDYVEGRASDELRARIQQHIDGCRDCYQVVLAAAGQESVAGASSITGIELTTFAPGSLVKDRYRIERFVGKGGMGEVYAAFDQLMQKRVALKTLLCTATDDPRAVRKLFAEVLNAQRVGHAQVCRINELQEHQDSAGSRVLVPFFTMEFVEGERLGTRLRRAPMPLGEVQVVARQLLEGLQAAHAKGVLHLDFKSDNVMLRTSENGPDAVIMDFGLSRALDSEARTRTSEQLQGAGTLPYMSLEQLECRPNLGPPVDVYAFGVVLYEMLTGRLPFQGDSLGAILLKQLRERPPPPSSVVPRLNPQLDAFVLKCLSSDPRQRYANATLALAALDRIGAWQLGARRVRWMPWAALALLVVLFVAIASRGEREVVMSNLPSPVPPGDPVMSAATEPAPAPDGIATSILPPSEPPVAPPPEAKQAPLERKPAAGGDQRRATASKSSSPAAPVNKAVEAPTTSAPVVPSEATPAPSSAPRSWPRLPRPLPLEPAPAPRGPSG
jgi:serine/threonine protein kinase